jgi:hypothetical protein
MSGPIEGAIRGHATGSESETFKSLGMFPTQNSKP